MQWKLTLEPTKRISSSISSRKRRREGIKSIRNGVASLSKLNGRAKMKETINLLQRLNMAA
jgi:hypothetical protein